MGKLAEKCQILEEAKEKWPEIPIGRSKNIIGQKNNHLTILYKTKAVKEGDKKSYFVAQCDCKNHNFIKVRSDQWQDGNTKSCGCLVTESLINEKFGKLTVLYDTGERNIRGCIMYMCQCDCGSQIIVSSNDLNTGHTKSCGCVKSFGELCISQILTQNNIPFQKEKSFKNCIFNDTQKPAKFDFYVNNKYLIEFDGEQHYKITSGWNTQEDFDKRQKHDVIKNQYCKDNNIPLIRIPYTHLKDLCLKDLLLETSQFLLKQEE